MKFKTINGWTKAKMRAVVEARKFNERAVKGPSCVYLTEDGNKCGVGLFIPENHLAINTPVGVGSLLFHFPELHKIFPLNDVGMDEFQRTHDGSNNKYKVPDSIHMNWNGNAKAAMLHFIDTRVEDGE